MNKWVVEHSIAALAKNSHTRANTDLFIKLSLSTLKDKLLLSRISNSVTSSGLPGVSRLFFEIKENDYLADPALVAKFAQKLLRLKCGIAIGDFGCSENSKHALVALPISHVILHRSLTIDILTKAEKQSDLRALVESCESSGVRVIAGGIEDSSTLSLVWGLGVRYFQGYFVQEPAYGFLYDFIGRTGK